MRKSRSTSVFQRIDASVLPRRPSKWPISMFLLGNQLKRLRSVVANRSLNIMINNFVETHTLSNVGIYYL